MIIPLPPPEWSMGVRKIDMVEILFSIETAKYIQFRAQCCKKYASNKKNKYCWKWNFIQKSQWTHKSTSSNGGARDLQRWICFKYFIVLKWESKCTFGLNATEITDYIKKLFKYRLLWMKFHTRKSVGTHIYLLQGVQLGPPKIDTFVSNILLNWNRKVQW